MAFPDTITITINSVATILNRIKDDNYGSEYWKRNANVDEMLLTIKNSSYTDKVTKRVVDRHSVELRHTINPVAPETVPTVRKSYLVLENQAFDTVVDPVKFTAGLVAFLTEANITKLVNFEA
jgi:hypothetical protein